MTEELSTSQIVKGTRALLGLNVTAMAQLLKVSRESYYKYIRGESEPAKDIVMDWFLHGENDQVREMALEIFLRRPKMEVPCICQTEIGDNGPCPRHAATLVEEKVKA